MITVLILMIAGILTGLIFRDKKKAIALNDKLTSGAIYLLLFFLGISIGTNKAILNNLENIGFQALIITIGALTGSLITAKICYNLFFRKNENIKSHNKIQSN
ncbi:MAG: LysO family transporter [Bacteroidota bacterium]|nr:LysO family transporter [Bacteroidota bacterium]